MAMEEGINKMCVMPKRILYEVIQNIAENVSNRCESGEFKTCEDILQYLNGESSSILEYLNNIGYEEPISVIEISRIGVRAEINANRIDEIFNDSIASTLIYDIDKECKNLQDLLRVSFGRKYDKYLRIEVDKL